MSYFNKKKHNIETSEVIKTSEVSNLDTTTKRLKILIIRFSSIGDIVLTTPVVRCLKLQKQAEIHYLTKLQYATIVQSNIYIDKVFTIKKDLSKVLLELKKENYDYIIDLHNNLRSWRTILTLGVKSYRFDKLNFQKWLIVNFKINRLPKIHIVDRYMNTVKPLSVENDGQGLDYFIPENQELATIEKNYIAFAIGAAHATKRLPLSKIIEICKQTHQTIILLGGKTEMKDGQLIAESTNGNVINLCGKLNLHQSAQVLKNADQVITHDTGMMHIAAAFQKNIISIWGNTIPEFGMYPYYRKDVLKNKIIEVKSLSCRPCSKIGHQNCPKKHFKCMSEISLESVRSQIEKK